MNCILLSTERAALFALFWLLSILTVAAQQSPPYYGIIIQGTATDAPNSEGGPSQNPALNDLLSHFNVESYSAAYVGARTLKAQQCYEIVLSNASSSDYETLAHELEGMQYEEVILLGTAQVMSEDINTSGPDPCVVGNPGHYLTNAKVREAWEITHGSPGIVIALIDQYMDYNHPDLDGKVISIWSSAGIPSNCNFYNHGYSMAGAMAAIPGNGICVEGTGYDTRVAFYSFLRGDLPNCPEQPSKIKDAIMQAYTDGHKIMSASLSLTGLTRAMMQEIIDSGVTFVHSCAGPNTPVPLPPNSSLGHNLYADIPGVIGVGQCNQNLDYVLYASFGQYWDYYVDIYAPCINVCRLQSPPPGSADECILGGGNSSFGAAMTSGIVALIMAVNPNLCPAEIENIIEISNQGLPNNAAQWPQMTQGIIDAEAAVIMAQTYGRYIIDTDTEWTSDRFVSELTIEPGAELKITNCTVSMGSDASVIVKRNARLILDNATMENCGSPWSGIHVWGNTSKVQPGPYASLNDPDQCGFVVMKNNAKLQGAQIGISTTAPGLAWPIAADYYGGLVDCENSEFVNCRKGVEFMQYPKSSSTLLFKNKSRFFNCRFEEVANTANPVDDSEGVTIWDTDGVEFQRCQFYNLDNEGILVYDASSNIYNANQFYNNRTGVMSMATLPYSTHLEVGRYSSSKNDFNGNKTHIDARATNKLGGLTIDNNEFFGGYIGVYMEGPTHYFVQRNGFDAQVAGVAAYNTGAMNTFQENHVACNTFSTSAGTVFMGENRQVQVLRNTFEHGFSDILVQDFEGITGAIRLEQGGAGSAAGNCFTTPINFADIETIGNTVSFKYFYRAETSCDESPNTTGNYLKKETGEVSDICEQFQGGNQEEPPVYANLVAKRNEYNNLLQQYGVDSSDANLSALLNIGTEKERILAYLVKSALENNDYLWAESLLSGENTLAAQHAVYGLKVNRGAIAEAKTMLNEMPSSTQDEIWFKGVQMVNLARIEQGSSFVLSVQQDSLLNLVAHSSSPVSAYAQSLLSLLKGQYFQHNMGVTPRDEPKEMIQTPKKYSLHVVPNPAHHIFTVDFGQPVPEGTVLIVADQWGRILTRNELSGTSTFTIGTEGWNTGLYFVHGIVGDTHFKSVLTVIK